MRYSQRRNQYGAILDDLPPITINQHNELIDGWHRALAAKRIHRTQLPYHLVETKGDEDLADQMWEANIKHGIQYTRSQRKTQGIKLHERGLEPPKIAKRVGVSASSVYGWTKAVRDRQKHERDIEISRLRDEGKTQQEIADQIGVTQGAIAQHIKHSKIGATNKEPESEAEPNKETKQDETGEDIEAAEPVNNPMEVAPEKPQETGVELTADLRRLGKFSLRWQAPKSDEDLTL